MTQPVLALLNRLDFRGYNGFMNTAIRIWFLIGIFSFAFLPASPAQGPTPSSRVRGMMEEITAVQKRAGGEGADRDRQSAAVREIIGRSFDFQGMSRRALGEYWDKLSPSERTDFQALFQGLFQDSYTKMVLEFLKEEKTLYGQEEVRGQKALVKTTLMRAGQEIPVDYSLNESQGNWLVDDVVVEGASIIGNYQQAFARVIQQESFRSLLQKLRQQQQASDKRS